MSAFETVIIVRIASVKLAKSSSVGGGFMPV
jgi:hypothetical protein